MSRQIFTEGAPVSKDLVYQQQLAADALDWIAEQGKPTNGLAKAVRQELMRIAQFLGQYNETTQEAITRGLGKASLSEQTPPDERAAIQEFLRGPTFWQQASVKAQREAMLSSCALAMAPSTQIEEREKEAACQWLISILDGTRQFPMNVRAFAISVAEAAIEDQPTPNCQQRRERIKAALTVHMPALYLSGFTTLTDELVNAYVIPFLQVVGGLAANDRHMPRLASRNALARLLEEKVFYFCLTRAQAGVRLAYVEQLRNLATNPVLEKEQEEMLHNIWLCDSSRWALLANRKPEVIRLTLTLLDRLLNKPSSLSGEIATLQLRYLPPYLAAIAETADPSMLELISKIQATIFLSPLAYARHPLAPTTTSTTRTEAPQPITTDILSQPAVMIVAPSPEPVPAPQPQPPAKPASPTPGRLPSPPSLLSPPSTPDPARRSPVVVHISSRRNTPTPPLPITPPPPPPPPPGILPYGQSITDPEVRIPKPALLDGDLERVRQFRRMDAYLAKHAQLARQIREAKTPDERRLLIQRQRQLERQRPEQPTKRSERDNTSFTNIGRDDKPLLPVTASYYYTEYVCKTGVDQQDRLVIGRKGEVYYTYDHYERGSFYFFGYLPPPTPPPEAPTPPPRTPTPPAPPKSPTPPTPPPPPPPK